MLRKDFWNIPDSDFLCPDKLGSSIEFMNRLRPAYWMTATSRGDNIPQSGDTFGALLMVPTTGAVQARMTLPREPQPLASQTTILEADIELEATFPSPYEVLSFRVLPQEPDQLLDQTALLSRRSAETLSPFQISALPQLFIFATPPRSCCKIAVMISIIVMALIAVIIHQIYFIVSGLFNNIAIATRTGLLYVVTREWKLFSAQCDTHKTSAVST
jgi:hypothetical protein